MNKVKIDSILKLPYPVTVKNIKVFLGHARFYRRFIKNFAKIAQLMTNLLKDDVSFNFFQKCEEAHDILQKALVTTLIIQPPNGVK